MKSNKSLKRLAEPGAVIYLVFLVAFAVAALVCKMYYLAAAEAGVILVLLVFSLIHKKRREKQPLDLPSAGSAFKRPEGHFAAALIEQAGLKGFSVGGAQVSEKHSGFVVNTGDATAADVYELMKQVRNTVYEKFHVELEPEVIILPPDYALEDNSPAVPRNRFLDTRG